jgi:UDP-N-acetylglucosamine--N-acetylmuramyl-(pentapeptide) pyrophosphoryl-undecaprenol N-acetylglucosamine transferase
MTQRIIFTGGGSAGHVTPNLVLISRLQQAKWEVAYIGSYQGIERELIARTKLRYYAISTGKLRRYFSWRNFSDPLKILWGIVQAGWYCYRFRPDVVFSKGGFVAFPVVVAARLLGIPTLVHESDLTPGLANRLSAYFASKVLLAFPQTQGYFSASKNSAITGTPVRPELLCGDSAAGRRLAKLTTEKPIVLIIGGSLGAQKINEFIVANVSVILEEYQLIHICGSQPPLEDTVGYAGFGYVHDALADLIAAADVVVSRAGATAIWELIATKKPHVLIPLSTQASRGDQIENARHFAALGVSRVLPEPELTLAAFLAEVTYLLQHRDELQATLSAQRVDGATEAILQHIIAAVA